MQADAAALQGCPIEDLVLAIRHFEDLEVFVGQRSRLHPGPGWALVLQILRDDLDGLRQALCLRDAASGAAGPTWQPGR